MAKQSPTHPGYLPGRAGLLALMTPEGREACRTRFADTPWPLAAEAPATPPPVFLSDFTVLDLEFQPQPAALLELAAVRYQNWQPVGKLVSFVQCRSELNPHVARLTGITRADLWNAPPEKAVLQAFKQLAGDSVLICHNIGADRNQLEAARTRCGATAPLANEWLCTLALAKQRRPKGAGNGLSELCLDFGINSVGAHRALRDVEMCAAVLAHFHRQQPLTPANLYTGPAKRRAPTLFDAAA